MTHESCRTCRFWENNHYYYAPKDKEKVKGDCLRYPPTIISNKGETELPVTNAYDWCGEWKENSKKEA